MSLEDDLTAELARLREQELLRRPATLEKLDAVRALLDGREVLVFCSNDYLGLTGEPSLAAAFRADASLVGSGASRLVSGTSLEHRRAETALARWVGLPSALLFASGYAANVGTLAALLGPDDVAFSDRLNHASLIDGLRLSRARIHVYPHRDVDALETLLRAHRAGARRAWVVSDTIFSMDGDAAPLGELRALCDRYAASLFVDDAHALGVVGQGRGLARENGVNVDVLVGTLGKAAGLSGAFVAGSEVLRTYLENRARSFVFSTGVSPVLARAIPTAVALIDAADDRRATVAKHARRIRESLRAQGWSVLEGDAAIVPVVIGDTRRTMSLSAALLERGIFVQGIRPPTVPDGTSRLRIVPTAAHREDQVERLVAAFAELAP